MEGSGERVELFHDLHGIEAAVHAAFVRRAAAMAAPTVKLESWPTSVTVLPEVGEALLRVEAHGGVQVLYDDGGALVYLSVGHGHVTAGVAHAEGRRVDEVVGTLRTHFPPPDPSAAHEVRVTFWTYSPMGPQPAWRSIAVPGWEEIDGNYSHSTHGKLAPLMSGFEPARGGQLVLWHGRAGTGKTYALRALAWEWRDWCEFHYIVDPDRFFGEHADYLMNVLLQPALDFGLDVDEGVGPAPVMVEAEQTLEFSGGGWAPYGPSGPGRPKPWKLLMLEDTGELLTADARAVIGQGLSRFLNVVDGLIGQGLRVLVLVTTNEEIRRLHPAVARPGRCAANVEFAPLAVDEARAWLERRGVDATVSGPTTLAALYALADGLDPSELGEPVGFGT
jgi:Domain of unknown function (DUF5925)